MTTHKQDSGLYERDFHAWAEQQAALLRRRADGALVNDAALDWSNIAEEIETLGRSEESGLSSAIGTIIEHLMKLQASPATDPRRGWMETVGRSRDDIEKHLDRNPGLRPKIPKMLVSETTYARRAVLRALNLYGEQPQVDVNGLAYTVEQVLGDWFPPER
jgi:Domain of unknown function DUF29